MDPLYRTCGHYMWEEEEENVKGNNSVYVCIILRLPVSCCFGTADFWNWMWPLHCCFGGGEEKIGFQRKVFEIPPQPITIHKLIPVTSERIVSQRGGRRNAI